MQLNINDASNHFSNVKYIQPIISKSNSRKSLNKILKIATTKKELYNKKENELNNSYENILNKILESKPSEINSVHYLKSSNNLTKNKKETATLERRISLKNKNLFSNDKNLKIPQISSFYSNGKLKSNKNSNYYDLTLSEMSKQGSQFSEPVSINNSNNGVKIFKKVAKINVMNFEISRKKNYNNLQNKNSLVLVSNQIVNINKKNINNLKDKIYEPNKENCEEFIQTEPWLMKNICEMKFTINTPKKRSFLCCF
jgi:hypothetical protein